MPAADRACRLSDTDLVLLAAAASAKAAATARLELYPRDLSAERAVKISQAGLPRRPRPPDEELVQPRRSPGSPT